VEAENYAKISDRPQLTEEITTRGVYQNRSQAAPIADECVGVQVKL